MEAGFFLGKIGGWFLPGEDSLTPPPHILYKEGTIWGKDEDFDS